MNELISVGVCSIRASVDKLKVEFINYSFRVCGAVVNCAK